MKQNYDEALNRLLKDEGGYSNHPSDPGGPTKYGITIADYRRYIKLNATAEDVKNMKVVEAKAIYKPKYWDAVKGDDLPSGVDYAVFDYGVNSGVSRANKVNAKFAHITDPVARINAICDERMAFLRKLKTFPVFGRGWTNRVDGVRKNSIRMAKGTSLPKPKAEHTGFIAGFLTFLGTMYAFVQTHPVAVVIGGVAAGLLIWAVVKAIKDRK